ncbi:energy-coupling factor ABC transporter ATP-binding protein [Lyngbya confervoides]|uniref:Energy-coupling factor ABC transporter ATP-binding protein n=1 Tax=Lyngbya confervoides BDU141951 TaxID=1574623 RepID=A0ABD4T6D5_9CYAN|nr:ABC transporter ATP-binding protein [Lyngbya confervoides]MCM1984273.1 energy-coupling factor ABC transporter ATP-binding protein [Lyngbya confervoides BDU141951]
MITSSQTSRVDHELQISNSSQCAIDLQQVSFSYSEQRSILANISLRIKAGERVGFIGHNGCGKTTLFRLVCGLLPAHQGTIHVFGKQVQPGTFHSEVGLLFQDPEDQLFSPSVWDDIAFGPFNLGLSEEEVKRRVTMALDLTGTHALANRPPHHLSGGEKQMVAIAGLLAMKPKIVLYDEPTASLDLRTRRRLIHFLQGSRETLVIASHDLEFLLEVCDRVILVDDGVVVADGEIRQVMRNQSLMEAHGLEKPHSLIPHPHPCDAPLS